MSKEKLDNITKLRDMIGQVFIALKEGQIEVHDAATLAKLADSMITSSKVELDYNKFTNNPHTKIEFLETSSNLIEGERITKKISQIK